MTGELPGPRDAGMPKGGLGKAELDATFARALRSHGYAAVADDFEAGLLTTTEAMGRIKTLEEEKKGKRRLAAVVVGVVFALVAAALVALKLLFGN